MENLELPVNAHVLFLIHVNALLFVLLIFLRDQGLQNHLQCFS